MDEIPTTKILSHNENSLMRKRGIKGRNSVGKAEALRLQAPLVSIT